MAAIYFHKRFFQSDTPKTTKDRIRRIGRMIHMYGFDGTLEGSLIKVENHENFHFIEVSEKKNASGETLEACKYLYVLAFYKNSPDVLVIDRICFDTTAGRELRNTRHYKRSFAYSDDEYES